MGILFCVVSLLALLGATRSALAQEYTAIPMKPPQMSFAEPVMPTGPLIEPSDENACVVHPGLSFDPRWGTVMRERYDASTETAPEARDVEVSGQIKIEVSRKSRTFKAPAILRLAIKKSGEQTFTELCNVRTGDIGGEIGRQDPDRYWLARNLPGSEPVTMRVEVTDLGSGGPTGEDPYTLEVEVQSSTAPTVGLYRGGVNPNPVSIDKGHCELITKPKRPQTRLELAHSSVIEPEAAAWLHLEYVTAGRNIYVQLEPANDDDLRVPISVKLFHKGANTFGFESSCTQTIGARQLKGRMLLATSAPVFGGFGQQWRIELSGAGNGSADASSKRVIVNLLRDVDPDRQLNASTNLNAAAYVCHGKSGRRTMPRTGVGMFAQSPMLRVEVQVDPLVLGPSMQERVVSHVLRALEVWRNACRQCRVENLLFVEVNGQLYWLPQSATMQQGDETHKSDFFEIRNARMPSGVYTKTSRSAKDVQNICSVPEKTASDGILAVQKMLGCGAFAATVVSPSPKMRLALKAKRTACGDDPNIVACEADYELIELNLLDYSFRLLDANGPAIGQGRRKVDLFHVVLHEVGHWLGIGHIDDGGDSVMASTMDTSRCIDSVTADAIGVMPSPQVSQGRPTAFRFTNKH
jgi:hypothetical protein